MKLKYNINSILKYNNDVKKSPYTSGIEAIILGNKCLCICNFSQVFIFNKIYRLIQTINLSTLYYFPKNMIPIINYPNLFALIEENSVHIYEIQLKKKKEKVKLKNVITIPKKYKDKIFYIFSLSCANILFFFQDEFLIYHIKEKDFTYKKISIPYEKKYELLRHQKYIIKIIEYKKNELIILLRDIIYDKENEDYECEFHMRNLIALYNIEKSELKKVYMNTEESAGTYNSYLGNYDFELNEASVSKSPNIFLINNSIVYIKDNQKEWGDKMHYDKYDHIYYSIYIINILTGDIKYEFEDNGIESKYFGFNEFYYSFQKSIHLCDNIFLFNGYEITVTKNGVKHNKIDFIYGTNEDDYKNNQHYFLKMKKDLFLMYNSHEIKICYFTKK